MGYAALFDKENESRLESFVDDNQTVAQLMKRFVDKCEQTILCRLYTISFFLDWAQR
jgi:hypothetical protein